MKARRNGVEVEHFLNKNNFPYPLDGIEVDIEKRWASGAEHDPRAISLAKAISELDFCFGEDYFCWKFGGDGDNGEHLVYLLDIYFEAKDNAVEQVREL